MSETPTVPKYTTPAGLEKAGRKLWTAIARQQKYFLRADELRILEDACREADLIDDLAAEAKGAAKIVRGSMGQDVINPLISELRQHRATLRGLLGSLKLPDEQPVPQEQQPRSVGARAAAASRWGKPA